MWELAAQGVVERAAALPGLPEEGEAPAQSGRRPRSVPQETSGKAGAAEAAAAPAPAVTMCAFPSLPAGVCVAW